MTVTFFFFFFYLWSCVLVTIPTVAAAFQCPSKTGYYNVADPDTKTGYYRCENGVATLQYCATGTYFSADSASCVAVPSAPDVKCNDGGFFQKPNPYDCTKFYKCDHGVPIPFDCPGGTHYNPTLHVCDWPDKAGCVAKQRPTTNNNQNNRPTSDTSNNQQNNRPTSDTNNNQNNNRPTSDTNNNNQNNEQQNQNNANNNQDVDLVICPAYIEPGTTKLMENRYDMTGETYYLCDSTGGMYLRFCPTGERFNSGLGRCNPSSQTPSKQGEDQHQQYHW